MARPAPETFACLVSCCFEPAVINRQASRQRGRRFFITDFCFPGKNNLAKWEIGFAYANGIGGWLLSVGGWLLCYIATLLPCYLDID